MRKIVFFILLLSFAGCTRKGTKVIQEEPKPLSEVMEETKNEVLEEVEVVEEETVKVEEEPVQAPPYLVAVIKKTACYGICPVFEARLFSNGHLTYHGEQDVTLLGRYEAWTELTLLESIKNKAYQTGYFNLSDVYPVNQKGIDDIPKTITYLNFDEREKTIINNYASPKLLRDFEDFLETTLLKVSWKKMDSGS